MSETKPGHPTHQHSQHEHAEELREEVREAAQRANHSPVVRWIAKGGLVAIGLVHILIGVIAISVASGLKGNPSQSGALATVAATPGGFVLLWIAAIAMFGLAFWQFTDAAWVTASRRRTLAMRRLTDIGKAIGFGVVGFAALIFALGGHANSTSLSRKMSAALLDTPGGIFILVAAGIIVGAVGVAHLVRGVTRRFRDELLPLTGVTRKVVLTLGLVGHLAKAAALLIVGVLVIVAAIFADPTRVTGVDGALGYLTTLALGPLLLAFIAIGFIAYGLYLFARAVYMRV
ncbi:MAG TPA: DUF1206 domain-containing protein [Microbacteriaceae bacterium]|jgi:hypothetical protein|nr:DUF1206 domain-containing protein [Microbacteriaceae bacterium]